MTPPVFRPPAPPEPRPEQRPGRPPSLSPTVRETLVLALLAGSAVLAFVVDPGRELSLGGLALALAPLAVLGWRHRAPLVVFLGVELLAVGPRLAFGPNGPSDLMILVALYAVASRAGLGRAAVAVATDVALLAATMMAGATVPGGQVGGELLGQAVIDVVVVLAALYLAARRQHLHALAERADRLARTQELEAQAAVDRERRRIARELHDVVAHHVSVMTLQAGAVRRHLQDLDVPPELDRAVADLRQTGEEAMGELRRLLGLLRSDAAEEDPHRPQPGLGDIPDLVARVRETGLDVSLALEGDLDQVGGGIGLTAYRVVQEALTNTLRHAGTVPTRVRLTVTGDQLAVEVRDQPPASPPPRYDPAPAGSGHGLDGMRERVELYGGTLVAGPEPEGGFRVRADLPIDPSPRPTGTRSFSRTRGSRPAPPAG